TIDNTHPTLTAVGIAVDNTGNANNGDDITLTVTASEAVSQPTCTFTSGGAAMADSSITYANPSGNQWTCVLDVADGDTDGSVAFSVAFTDSAGNAGTAVSAVTDSSAVTVDNTHPTLSNIAMTTSGNSGFAKSGDTISLAITVSETVTSLACTIDGEAATMGGSGTSWTAALQMSGDETAGAAGFSCGSHVDAAGNTGSADTSADSGAVTIDFTAPTLSPVGIATAGSGNANNGDTVTLSFTANEAIQSPTCTMKDGAGNTMDNSVSVNEGSSNAWTCAVSTSDSDSNGAMTFSIAFSDDAGNAGTAVTAVSDSSSVTIDNTHPTLTAVGIAVDNTGNANNGDDITLTVTASEAVSQPTCTFTS
ncbi:MAG: hypothetical protein GY899_06810, partial [Verrucomicrobiaceae bacterium]|nr:hypothetical protein [Verrucomicrobiaceae bacterium]